MQGSYGKKVTIEDLNRIFKSIDHNPLATASIAQVHIAYLPDGRKVALKVIACPRYT